MEVKSSSLQNDYLRELLSKANSNLGKTDPQKIMDFLLKNIMQSNSSSNGVQTISMEKAVYDALEQIDLRKAGQIVGLKSRWPKLDRVLGGGWQKGKTIVLAARPGNYKTGTLDILLDDFTNTEINPQKVLVVFWNFEMFSHNQVLRMVSRRNKKPVNALLSAYGTISNLEYEETKLTLDNMKSKNILFIDVPTTTSKMFSKMVELSIQYKDYHLVSAIDHSLLIAKDGEKNNQELVQNLTKVCLMLKKSLNCTNIILSQIKREADGQDRASEEYVPRISDLVWNSEMEQDADVIMFLHSPKKFNLATFQGLNTEGLLALIVSKNREGESDLMIPMKVDMGLNSMEEMTPKQSNLDFSI